MKNYPTSTNDSVEISKMFHEIKNPLTLINSSLQLIERDHPEVKDFRFWNQTLEDLANLRKLINELSDYQKGTFLNITKINLFDFTEDLLESTAGFLLETGTPLVLDCDILDIDFYGDVMKLRQAVVNLLKNAAESSPFGSPIRLSITTDSERLFITIEDKGCGINKELRKKIFEPFHTTKPYGTGLGIPIVKRIVRAHGGQVAFDSIEGDGTIVYVILPLSQG